MIDQVLDDLNDLLLFVSAYRIESVIQFESIPFYGQVVTFQAKFGKLGSG